MHAVAAAIKKWHRDLLSRGMCMQSRRSRYNAAIKYPSINIDASPCRERHQVRNRGNNSTIALSTSISPLVPRYGTRCPAKNIMVCACRATRRRYRRHRRRCRHVVLTKRGRVRFASEERRHRVQWCGRVSRCGWCRWFEECASAQKSCMRSLHGSLFCSCQHWMVIAALRSPMR